MLVVGGKLDAKLVDVTNMPHKRNDVIEFAMPDQPLPIYSTVQDDKVSMELVTEKLQVREFFVAEEGSVYILHPKDQPLLETFKHLIRGYKGAEHIERRRPSQDEYHFLRDLIQTSELHKSATMWGAGAYENGIMLAVRILIQEGLIDVNVLRHKKAEHDRR